MTNSIQSVDDIRSAFPEPTVQKIIGEPTYETIKALHNILKSNAAAIPTTLGGGNHGHLGLVLQPASYTVVTGSNLTAPNNPGATPNIPEAATGAQIGAIIRQFHSENKTYLENHRTDQALKQVLLGTVKKITLTPYVACTLATPQLPSLNSSRISIILMVKFRTWIWTKINEAWKPNTMPMNSFISCLSRSKTLKSMQPQEISPTQLDK